MAKPNLNNIKLQMSAGFASQFPKNPLPHIVFLGRSNVGKSSLINTLLGRKSLARVSSAPGKTVTVNFYNIDEKLFFVDLPGYGYAKRSPEEKAKWSELTEGYVTMHLPVKRLYLLLIDCKSGPTNDDRQMFAWLEKVRAPFFLVLTKCDKVNKTERKEMLDSLQDAGVPVIPFSSLSGEGKDEIRKELSAFLAD